MDYVYYFNAFETVLWTSMGLFVGYRGSRTRQRRGRLILCSLTFFLFAGSEVVEMQTGAWWRPTWLLVWKGVCIAILVYLGIDQYRWNRQKIREQSVD